MDEALEKALAYLWKIRMAAETTTVNDDPNVFAMEIRHLADAGISGMRREAQEASGRRFHGNN